MHFPHTLDSTLACPFTMWQRTVSLLNDLRFFMSLTPYFLASRPKTLPAAIVPVAAASIIVWHVTAKWSPLLALWTVLSALFIQIATNFFNDAIDHDKRADTKARTGPMRVTASGVLPRKTVYAAAILCLLIACGFALPLISERGWPIIAMGIPSLFLTYGYTGGPLPLAYKGLGELFVFLFFGLVAVIGSVYVQVGFSYETAAVYAAAIPPAIQCGLLSCVIIEINNIRDRKEDTTTGKRTLAVRLGDIKARRLCYAFLLASYVLLPLEFKLLKIHFTGLWVPTLLIALFLAARIRMTPAGKKMNALLPLSSAHLIFFFLTLWAACYLE